MSIITTYGRALLLAALIALIAAVPAVAIKYVAVVETEMDAASGASAKINSSEVRLITTELRREAVKNLPKDRFSIMTAETVQAQGGAVLEACADENCVITLGNKIGADYIVRGIVSKLKTKLTLSVEIYETEDGTLVASSDAIRSENIEELIEKTAVACAAMYKSFVGAAQRSTPQPKPTQSSTYNVTINVDPVNGGYVSRSPIKTTYNDGEILTLMAMPYAGYTFTKWSGSSNSANATLMGPVNRDLTLTANFQYIQQSYTHAPNKPAQSDDFVSVYGDTKQTYTLTTNVFPPDWGSVIRNPDKNVYAYGETVTLLATPYNNYTFASWTGETADKANSVAVITMDGDKTLTANFHGQLAASSSRDAGKNKDMKKYYIGVSLPLLGSPTLNGEWACIEGGWFGNNNMAYGFEFGGGFLGDSHNQTDFIAGIGRRETIGGGFNVSRMGKRWVFGLSTGYWYGRFELEGYTTPLQIINVFGGPFIKLRFLSVCEFSYRGLMGYEQDGTYDFYSSTFVPGSEKDFTWASQFKFGLHFEI